MRGVHATPLALLADEQHGVVTREQLRSLGYSDDVVDRWVARGLLRRLHRGVYAYGSIRLTAHGWLMAAVLAGGPGAVASHRSAAWLHGLLAMSRPNHEVTTTRHRSSKRVDFHRCRLVEDDVTTVDGIATTTVARTLLDLTDVVRVRHVERAIEQAEVRRTLDIGALESVLSRANGRRGTRVIRTLIERRGAPTTLTASELEELFLDLVRRHRLPAPHVNLDIGGVRVDFAWPHRRLVVELDGAETHLTRTAFERDRERDQKLAVAGWRVIRITWRQLVGDPDGIATTVARLLA